MSVQVLGRLPVLIEEERARVFHALVQVLVDVPLLLAGGLNERLQRLAQLVLLARSSVHVRDDGQQVATVIGGCGHPCSKIDAADGSGRYCTPSASTTPKVLSPFAAPPQSPSAALDSRHGGRGHSRGRADRPSGGRRPDGRRSTQLAGVAGRR